MEKAGNSQQDLPWVRAGSQWASAQCLHKVEEMLSRAIIHQEALWAMLVVYPAEDQTPDKVPSTGEAKPNIEISPRLLRVLKSRLENSMDWCHLSLTRIKEIISHTGSLPPLDTDLADGLFSEDPSSNPHSIPKMNASSPGSPLPVWLSKDHLNVPNPFNSSPTDTSRLSNTWSIDNLYTNKTSEIGQLLTCVAPADAEKQLQQSMGLLGTHEEHQHGQEFAELPSPRLDTTWGMLSEAQVAHLEGSLLPVEAPHQSSSNCHLKLPEADRGARLFSENDERSIGSKLNSRISLHRSSSKRDREELSDEETTVAVVFQKMKPGRDKKKAIPDDDHRGWKKYGNKSIQNSNFCRGYYKCSMVDCRAKKMVQPTDQDPSIFEVTYVGKHTCSGSTRRRHRSRTIAPPPSPSPTAQLVDVMEVERQSSADEEAGSGSALYTTKLPVNGSSDVRVQTKIARLIKSHGGSGVIEADNANSLATKSNNDGSYEDDQLSKDSWSSRSSKQMLIDNNSVEPNDSNKTDLVPEDPDQEEGSYFKQGSQHQQSSYSFQQESLLWPEINMDPSTLSSADPI